MKEAGFIGDATDQGVLGQRLCQQMRMVQALSLKKANRGAAKALLKTQLQAADTAACGSCDLGHGDRIGQVFQDMSRAAQNWSIRAA